jgi:hypothetical protein
MNTDDLATVPDQDPYIAEIDKICETFSDEEWSKYLNNKIGDKIYDLPPAEALAFFKAWRAGEIPAEPEQVIEPPPKRLMKRQLNQQSLKGIDAWNGNRRSPNRGV